MADNPLSGRAGHSNRAGDACWSNRAISTNMVTNLADTSVESSIVGDCKTKNFETMSNVVYDGTYRTGKGEQEPGSLDHDLKHMEPGTDMEYVFAIACATP